MHPSLKLITTESVRVNQLPIYDLDGELYVNIVRICTVIGYKSPYAAALKLLEANPELFDEGYSFSPDIKDTGELLLNENGWSKLLNLDHPNHDTGPVFIYLDQAFQRAREKIKSNNLFDKCYTFLIMADKYKHIVPKEEIVSIVRGARNLVLYDKPLPEKVREDMDNLFAIYLRFRALDTNPFPLENIRKELEGDK